MSETSSAEQASASALPLHMHMQYTKDLSFEVPNGAETFATLQTPPVVSVNIDLQADKLRDDQLAFEVILKIRVEANEAPTEEGGPLGRTVFITDLAYAAIVTLENPPEQLVEPILLVEVPRLLFPYARNIICDVTRDGGFPPVVLQPIDFVAMWQAKRQQMEQTAGHA